MPDEPSDLNPEATPDSQPVNTTVEVLTKLLQASSDAAAQRAVEAMSTTAAATPPSTAPDTTLQDQLKAQAEQARDLLNEGKGDEVIKMLQDNTLNPMSASIRQLAINQGQNNLERMRERYGEKFTKREEIFNQQMRKYNITSEQLADNETMDRLWFATLYEDRDAYNKEEAESHIAAAKKESEDKISSTPSPQLLPITNFVPEATNELKDLAEKHLSSDPVTRQFEIGQIAAYGITVEGYLNQCSKKGDPRYTYGVGAGDYYIPLWTVIGGKTPAKSSSSSK